MTKSKDISAETVGAWIVHHGNKIQADVAGPSEFPALDTASKAGKLLASMASSDNADLSSAEVAALAKASRLNPKLELPTTLQILKERELIDVAKNGAVSVLGVSSRKILQETSKIYRSLEPGTDEDAALDLAESVSNTPRRLDEEAKRIADTFRMKRSDADDFLRRSQEIGFVDAEGEKKDRILFNGNLFRRDSVEKSKKIIDSLNLTEVSLVNDISDRLRIHGCLPIESVKKILGDALFEKLRAAGFYDVNGVSNADGEHLFVTAPGSFHKFVNPLVDDAFDLAKCLVAALTYGIVKSDPGRGRIMIPSLLVSKLVSGLEVGPATAIGQDYRVLEINRVIQLRPASGNRFYMRLLKRDIGEIALQVLTRGGAVEQILGTPPSAAMSGFIAPEETRSRLRRAQKAPSRKHTEGILQTLREQSGTW